MIMEKLDHLFRLISRFALLNILWLGFTLLGLAVIGFFPATVAMFSVSRQWVRGEREFPVVKTFFNIFKTYLFKANLYGWIAVICGFVLYVNYHAINLAGADIPLIVVVSFILIVIFYLLMVVSAIPVSIHFEGSSWQLFRKTIMFVFGRFHIAVLFLLLVWGGAHLSLLFPAVILFFSGSVLSYMLMWLFTRTLEKIQGNQSEHRFS